MKDIMNMNLSEQEAENLIEVLTTWKEEIYVQLVERVEQEKSEAIDKIEEASEEFQNNLRKEYSEKTINLLAEMRDQIEAEAVARVLETNPELQVLEKVKEIVAPTLSEDYGENVYANEIQVLHEELEKTKRQLELREGADRLAELLQQYDDKTRELMLGLIKEGNEDEVTEQFFDLAEAIENAVTSDEDEYDDEDDEDDDYEDEDFDEDDDFEDDEDEDDFEDDEDEDDDFDEDTDDSYINTGENDNLKEKQKTLEESQNLTQLGEIRKLAND